MPEYEVTFQGTFTSDANLSSAIHLVKIQARYFPIRQHTTLPIISVPRLVLEKYAVRTLALSSAILRYPYSLLGIAVIVDISANR
jgi:hypothetical protein